MSEPLWQWEELVAAAQGEPEGAPAGPVTGFSIDTRTLQAGDVFVVATPGGGGFGRPEEAVRAAAAGPL